LTKRKKIEEEMIKYQEDFLGVKLIRFSNIKTRKDAKIKESDMVSIV